VENEILVADPRPAAGRMRLTPLPRRPADVVDHDTATGRGRSQKSEPATDRRGRYGEVRPRPCIGSQGGFVVNFGGPEPDAGAALATLCRRSSTTRWLAGCTPTSGSTDALHPLRRCARRQVVWQRTAWRLGEFSAVALWLAPLVEPADELIRQVLTESIAPDRFPEMFSLVEQIDAAHPISAVWYLPGSVSRGRRRARAGGQLMGHCLRVVDAAHGPLISKREPRNISFYERHGSRSLARLRPQRARA